MLNNVFYLNKNLFLFNETALPLYSFCKIDEKTAPHLFSECPCVNNSGVN